MAMSKDDITKANRKADDAYNKNVSALIADEDRAKKEASDKISEVAKRLLAQAKSRGGNKDASEILRGAEALVKETVGEITKDLASLMATYNKKESKLKRELDAKRKKWTAENTEANAKALARVEESLEQLGTDFAEEIDYLAKTGEADLAKVSSSLASAQSIANTKMGEKLGKQMRLAAIKSAEEQKKEFNANRKDLKESVKNQRDLLQEMDPGNAALLGILEGQLTAIEKKDYAQFEKLSKDGEEAKKSIEDKLLKQYLAQAKDYRKESLARRALGDTLGGGIDKLGGLVKDGIKGALGSAASSVGKVGIGPLTLGNAAKLLVGTAKFGKGLIDQRRASSEYDKQSIANSAAEATAISKVPAVGVQPSVPGSPDPGIVLDKMTAATNYRSQLAELKAINKNLKNISKSSGDSGGLGGLGGLGETIGSLIGGKAFLDLASKVRLLLGFGGLAAPLTAALVPIATAIAGAAAILAPMVALLAYKDNKERLQKLAKDDPDNAELKNNAYGRELTGKANSTKQGGAQLARKALKTLRPGEAKEYLAAGVQADGKYIDGYSKDQLDAMAAGKALKPDDLEQYATPTAVKKPVVSQQPAATASPVSVPTLASAATASPVSVTLEEPKVSSAAVNAQPPRAQAAASAPTMQVTPTASVPTQATLASGGSLPSGLDGSNNALSGTPAKPSNGDLKSVANISGNVDMAGLNPALRNNFRGLATEYFEKTGKKLQVNSGYRSFEKQKALYEGFKAGKPGFNPANRPGTSLHEFGFALDVEPSQVDELNKMGLVSKYGFERLSNPKERQHLQVAGGEAAIRANGSGLASGDSIGVLSELASAKGAGSGDATVSAAAMSVTSNSQDSVKTTSAPAAVSVADSGGSGSDSSGGAASGSRGASGSSGTANKRNGSAVSASSMPTFSYKDPSMFAINVGAVS